MSLTQKQIDDLLAPKPSEAKRVSKNLMSEQILILTGKSLKGKNRVREHGTNWVVLKENTQMWMIAPMMSSSGTELRWVNKHNDPDFVITVS